MTKTISISQARKEIFAIAEEVQKPGLYFTLTEKGRPKVVILSAEEFESLIETMEVLSQFPNLEKSSKKADEAVKSGNFKDYITLGELEKKLGLKKNEVSSNRRKKTSKKNR